MSTARPMRANTVTPGHTILRRSCQHWLDRRWAEGHPRPCARVHWQGVYHRKPKLMLGEDHVVVC